MLSRPDNKLLHKSYVDHGISVVVLTYNSEKYIEKCIKSIENQINKKSEIIVVDNNSSDRTVTIVENHTRVRLFINQRNNGFAKGVNKGIKNSSCELILILNPDTELKKDSLRNLIECLYLSSSDIAGGVSIKNNGSYHGSYVRTPDLKTLIFDYTNLRKLYPNDQVHKHHYYEDETRPTSFKYVDAVSGSFMLLKRNTIKRNGFFDESFWMYLEDVDYCTRAKQKGMKIVLCPKAQIKHVGGASSNNKDRINHHSWYRARSTYVYKHFGVMTNILVQPLMLVDKVITELWMKIK